MMERTLYKALLKGGNGFIIAASLSIIGIYAGYLLWYVPTRYLARPASDYRALVCLLTVWLCAFAAIYRIPDRLFTNRRIGDVLCLPVTAEKIVFLVTGRIACLQLGICIAAFWPCFFYDRSGWASTLGAILFCWINSCLIDFCVLLISMAVGNLFSSNMVGYGFIVFQYGAFLLQALAAGNVVSGLFRQQDLLLRLDRTAWPKQWTLIAVPALSALAWTARVCARHWYIRGYMNTRSFRYGRKSKAAALVKIGNPCLFLEWKRVSRNKELIFFSNIKNILTVFVLCGFLLQNVKWIGLPEKYMPELFLLMSCCAVNTISSTAYSGDGNKPYYAFLPISARRLFFWKTIQGFLWGEITVFLFWMGDVFLRRIPALDACLLLVYGTTMNYACSWLGVFLDYKMPRTANSINELLHGNISKVIVLAASTALTIWEIHFVTQRAVAVPALPFAVCLSAGIVVIECCFGLFCRRNFRD